MNQADVLPLENLSVRSSRWWSQAGAALLILYEIGWVVPWYRALMRVRTVPPLVDSLLVLGGVLLITYLLAWLLSALRLLHNIQLGVLIGLLVVALVSADALLVVNEAGFVAGLVSIDLGVLITALATVWMWWRGFTLLYNGIRPIVVWRRFRLGLAAFMGYIFYIFQWRIAPPGLAWYVGFLFVGLLAVIFTRIAYVWVAKGGQRSPFDRRWLAAILGSLGLVLLASGFVGSLFSGQYRMLLDMVSELVRLAGIVLLFLLSLPVILFSFILWPLVAWLDRLMQNATIISNDTFNAPSPYPYPYPMAETQPSQALVIGSSVCFWVVFVILAAVLFLRARRTMVEDYMPEMEAPEFILGRGEATQILRHALQEGWEGLVDRLRPVKRWQAAERIRRAYAQLLELSAARGQARLPSQTPLEFLPALAQAFPGKDAESDLITQAYLKIRYGQYPEALEDVRRVEEALASIKRVMDEAVTPNKSQG